MASLLEEDVCDDVFWFEILPLLNLKDFVALASTSTTMRRRCFWIPDSTPGLTIPQRDLYNLLAPVSADEEDRGVAGWRPFNPVQRRAMRVPVRLGARCNYMELGSAEQIAAKMDTARAPPFGWPNASYGVHYATTRGVWVRSLDPRFLDRC